MRILLILLALKATLQQVSYDVTVDGTGGNTEMQMFNVDDNGNLALALISSDLNYVSTANSNIAMYWPSTEASWLWAKQMVGRTNEVLIDLKIKGSDSSRMALLYQSSLVIVLNTAKGTVVEKHT